MSLEPVAPTAMYPECDKWENGSSASPDSNLKGEIDRYGPADDR